MGYGFPLENLPTLKGGFKSIVLRFERKHHKIVNSPRSLLLTASIV